MVKVLYLSLGVQQSTELAFKDVCSEVLVWDFWGHYQQFKSVKKTNDMFWDLVTNFKPDLIHMQLQFTNVIEIDTLKKVKSYFPNVIMSNWTGDIRKNIEVPFVDVSRVVDYSLMSNVGQIEFYYNNGCHNPSYWQIGYDERNFYPKQYDNFEYDISFVANSYNINQFPDVELRQNMGIKLKQKYGSKFGLFGNGWSKKLNIQPISMPSTNEVYNKSMAVLSISNFNNVSHYFSDRLLMCLASGRPTISWNFPGSSSYFKHEENIIFVSSYEEIIFWVEKFKNEPQLASYIGMNGAKTVKQEHTMKSRIIELMYITGLWEKL